MINTSGIPVFRVATMNSQREYRQDKELCVMIMEYCCNQGWHDIFELRSNSSQLGVERDCLCSRLWKVEKGKDCWGRVDPGHHGRTSTRSAQSRTRFAIHLKIYYQPALGKLQKLKRVKPMHNFWHHSHKCHTVSCTCIDRCLYLDRDFE